MKLAIMKINENNQALLPAMKVIKDYSAKTEIAHEDHKLVTMKKTPLMPPQPKAYIKCKKYDFF